MRCNPPSMRCDESSCSPEVDWVSCAQQPPKIDLGSRRNERCAPARRATAAPARSRPASPFENVSHNWGSSPSEQQVHSKVSLRRAVDAVQRWRVACARTGQGWESGTTRKQPANLAVEGAEHATLVMNLQFSILMAQTTDPSSWH
jgi:hypothetical protein